MSYVKIEYIKMENPLSFLPNSPTPTPKKGRRKNNCSSECGWILVILCYME